MSLKRLCTDCKKWIKVSSEKEWQKHVDSRNHASAVRKRIFGK